MTNCEENNTVAKTQINFVNKIVPTIISLKILRTQLTKKQDIDYLDTLIERYTKAMSLFVEIHHEFNVHNEILKNCSSYDEALEISKKMKHQCVIFENTHEQIFIIENEIRRIVDQTKM
jgi:hypothetical protein